MRPTLLCNPPVLALIHIICCLSKSHLCSIWPSLLQAFVPHRFILGLSFSILLNLLTTSLQLPIYHSMIWYNPMHFLWLFPMELQYELLTCLRLLTTSNALIAQVCQPISYFIVKVFLSALRYVNGLIDGCHLPANTTDNTVGLAARCQHQVLVIAKKAYRTTRAMLLVDKICPKCFHSPCYTACNWDIKSRLGTYPFFLICTLDDLSLA